MRKVIRGNGSSLWGDSKGTYIVTSFECVGDLNVNVFGENTHWTQYTDRGIEKQITTLLKADVEAKIGRKIKKLSWSEQGMQPDNGWNFDII